MSHQWLISLNGCWDDSISDLNLLLKPISLNTNLNNYMYTLSDITVMLFMSFINSMYLLFLTYNLCLAAIRRRRTLCFNGTSSYIASLSHAQSSLPAAALELAIYYSEAAADRSD